MNNLLKLGKKIFTVGVVATTIFWSLGVAALVPAVANAATETDCATLVAGDLVKTSISPVIYAVNADKTKSYFPQGDSFKSWTADNKYTYKLISQACLSSLKSATAVLPRPGTYLVKEQASDAVYMVLPGNKLAELSAAAATALYGTNYKAMPAKGGHTITMDDPSWTFYSQLQVGGFGAKLTESLPTEGALVKVGTTYYVVGANKTLQEVTATGLTANRFQTKFAHTLTATTGFTVSSSKVEAAVATLVDRTQGAGGAVAINNVPSGDLTVSLSADTPAATTLSKGTVYNNVLTLKLSAGSTDVTVKGLTVKKAGLVANTDISGVSVWVDGFRKGDVMSSFNSDNKVSIGFANTAIVVPANGYKLVTVALNLIATGGTVAAQIAASTDIDTKATVGGTFPITGNTFALTDGSSTLASVKVEGQSVGGQAAEPVAADSGQIEIGQTQEVAKFKLTESGINDAYVEKLIFYVEGTVKEKDLQNFELYAPDNSLLGSAASISDRYLTIKLNTPYKISKGTNRTLTLKTTVLDGAGNWFRIQLQSDSDLMVKDGGNTFYVLPYITAVGTTWSAVVPTTGYFKLKSGSLTIVKNTTSPSANLAKGSTDVLLGKFDVKAVGEAVEIRKLYLQIDTSTASISTRLAGNVKVVVDGSTVLTQSAAANAIYAASTQYTLSQYVTIKSGETKVFEVRGDIDSAAAATSQYKATIGKAYVKRLSTLDYVDNQPNQLIAANNLSLGGNTPSIAKDTSLGNKTLSPGGDSQVLGRWIVKAPESEDIDVTASNFIFTGSSLNVASYLQNLALYSGDTQLGSTQSVAASTSNNFTFTLNVPKNTTKVLTLKGLVVSSATTGKLLKATISSLSYIGKTTNTSSDDTAGYAGQENTINTATITMSAASDSTTVSKVLLPSASEVQLGKWKVTVNNQDVTYNKLRLYLDDEEVYDVTSGNFGTLSLYEEGKETTPLSTGSYLSGSGNGYVEFTGMNWTVLNGSVKYLVLKGSINGSGTMNEASYNAWALGPTSTTNFDVTAGGSNVSVSSITVSSPTSTFYLFHNTAPKIVKNGIGTSLALNTQAPIFSFTVYNNGDREMTLSTTSVYISVSGLTSAASATGTISSFKLWNSSASGELGTNLASADTANQGVMCLSGGGVAGNTCIVSNATTTVFGGFSETVTVPAGGSRTFIVTADTTDVLDGKTQGTISISAMLDGATGYNSAGNTTGQTETHWAAGKLLYFYTPVNGSQNGTAYGASDSYDVVGDTMVRSA